MVGGRDDLDFSVIRQGDYAIGLAVMVPFFSTPWYTGPVADAVDGADLSIFVGLPVAALLYFAFARGLDRTEERQLAQNNADEEAIAAADRAQSAL